MTGNQQTNTWQPPARPQAGPAEGVIFAGFWIRVVAWIIDAVAIGVLASVLAPFWGAGPVFGVDGSQVRLDYGANAVGGLIGLVYFVGLWTWRGQTLGMMPLNLWVLRAEDGGRLDVVTAFLRYVGLIVSFAAVLLGVLWVAFDSQKQGWHDKLAKSYVVRRPV